MRAVKAVNPHGESLLDQLVSLYLTFKNIQGSVVFDLSYVTWAFPILILPIASYIHDTGSDFRPPLKPEVESYLNFVKFPRGVSSVYEMRRGENYIPITLLKDKSPVERSRLQKEFLEMIYLWGKIPRYIIMRSHALDSKNHLRKVAGDSSIGRITGSGRVNRPVRVRPPVNSHEAPPTRAE